MSHSARLVSVQQLVNSRRFVRRYQENHSRRSKQNLSTLQRMAEESVWRQWEQVCCEILQGKLAFFPLNESLWELVSYQVLRPKTKSDPSATTDSGCSMENTVSTEKHKRSSTCSEPMDLERQENSSEKLMNALTISPTSPMSFSLLQYSENENHYSLRQKELVGEFYSVDELLTYEPFCADFGPLNLGQLYRFVQLTDKKMTDADGSCVYFYCKDEDKYISNAAVLIAGYAIFRLGMSADDIYRILEKLEPRFCYFKDASFVKSSFQLTVKDCIDALDKARSNGFFDPNQFDIEEYEFFEQPLHGDLNWIVPGKLVAFSGPTAVRTLSPDGSRSFTPEDYIPYFRKKNVTCVVRLNNKMYEARRFVDAGIHHYDLYFDDGATPSRTIVRQFLNICATEQGAVAVHCKAGLGRTGTLICCALMRYYNFRAAEAIAWVRICRPGSVLGRQQSFLVRQEMEIVSGDIFIDNETEQPQHQDENTQEIPDWKTAQRNKTTTTTTVIISETTRTPRTSQLGRSLTTCTIKEPDPVFLSSSFPP